MLSQYFIDFTNRNHINRNVRFSETNWVRRTNGLTGRFRLFRQFTVAICCCPHVCFVLVLISISCLANKSCTFGTAVNLLTYFFLCLF